jgi:2-polyprenyl-6-methoxyphenol hydroxylase-like FAD-dependent oxidoreductase
VRRRLLALPNVRLLDGREVTGFAMSGDNTRVTGVRLQAPGGGQEETLEGALVVDASGRGSRTPQWLETLGFSRVEETRIQVDVGYASLLFRLPPDIKPGWKMLSIAPDLPRTRRFGVVASIEEDRFLASVGGWLGEHPPTDEAGFLEFARSLSQPHLYEVLRLAEPLAPISPYRFPYHQRRHYERLSRFPEGLAVVGDAVCSFNPTYGQGITTGALQAEMLGKCLRQGLEGATQRYRRQLGELLGVPWAMATTGDLRFPEVEGARPPGFALTNWYGDRLQQLAGYDQDAMKAFVRVIHMLDSPAAMFSPRLALKVLTARPDAAVPSPGPEPLTPSRSQAA